MAKMHILVGIPGSGKSTLATKIVSQGDAFRVNFDDLRAMLFPGAKWSRDKEDTVVKIAREAVKTVLKAGRSVIIDNTNLTSHWIRSWTALAKEHEAKIETQYLDTPLDICIARDIERAKTSSRHCVGQAVIERFALKSGRYNLDFSVKKKVVFVDVDGTIANLDHRLHFLDNKDDRNRWPKFFEGVINDTPIMSIINWVKQLSETHHIIIVSGRAWDLAGEGTVNWLTAHNVPYDRLLMRLPSDKRQDTETKSEILDEYLLHHPKDSIDFVIDDRPSVVAKWRSRGLQVKQVYNGEIIQDPFYEHSKTCVNYGQPIPRYCSACGALEDF